MSNDYDKALAYYSGRNTAPMAEGRKRSITLAVEACSSLEILQALCDATRLARAATVDLPAHRYEGLARGRGWARKGRGGSAEWGERVDGGYRVGPGRWIVGGSDGFARRGETEWVVRHVTVGAETWTIAS
jgi:hypothetical protein